MRVRKQRPIQKAGWAFQLQRPLSSWEDLQAASVWASIVLAVLCAMLFVSAAPLDAQLGEGGHPSDHDHHGASAGGWEGSAQGVAYSEFNHHLAGLFVLLMGCAELSLSLRLPSRLWIRFLLPTAMLLGSVILLVWSDHEAWPIGPLSLAQTFSGHDPEIIQHKVYGLLLFLVGTVEALRRVGRISDGLWSAPLPLFAIIGGLMLFGHSHGLHPSAHKIAMGHALMGTIAVTAGSSKLLSDWFRSPSHERSSKWELLWAGLILLIGMQLLLYSE
ncbi:MAG: hypothetical protein AAB242_05040 [Nitrospirota bacterium]